MRPARALSTCQRKVAELIASGLSNPAIAAALGVGRRTIDTHVRHILRKLGLHSRVQIGCGWRCAPRPRDPRPVRMDDQRAGDSSFTAARIPYSSSSRRWAAS